jgi:hypothetical protein
VVNNPYDPATTSRDFVPWRFSDADRRSLWLLLTIGVGETCTKEDADILWRAYRSKEIEIAGAQADYDRALSNTLHLLAQPNFDAGALRSAIAGLARQALSNRGTCHPIAHSVCPRIGSDITNSYMPKYGQAPDDLSASERV